MGAHNTAGQTGGKADDPEPKPATRSRRDGYDKEDALQTEAASFFDYALPADSWWCHIPNQGMFFEDTPRTRKAGGKFKRQGLKAGAPDNLIVYGGRAFFIELKSRYGSLNDAQKVVVPKIEGTGSPVAICRTLDEIEKFLNAWGIPLQHTLAEFRAPRLSIQAGWKAALQERMTAAAFVRLARANRGRRAKT